MLVPEVTTAHIDIIDSHVAWLSGVFAAQALESASATRRTAPSGR
jgi:hypothetical protein